MRFSHAPEIWAMYPELSAEAMAVSAVHPEGAYQAAIADWTARARGRLAAAPEGEWPEVQAWRRAFSRMGLKPTQYRCAAESLLRRLRQSGDLPALLPLIALGNAVSAAFGVPVALFDTARISGDLTVRPATGSEVYEDFSGAQETPSAGEVIFADSAGAAHARRWCHRQSRLSAVSADTRSLVIIVEAMHPEGAETVAAALDAVATALKLPGTRQRLTAAAPNFAVG